MKRLYLLFLLLSLMSTAFAQRVALRTDCYCGNYHTQCRSGNQHQPSFHNGSLNGAYNAWKFGNDMKLNLT